MVRKHLWLTGVFAILVTATAWADSPLRVLIVDGQNNHQWKKTTPLLKSALEDAGCFQVDVATSPSSETHSCVLVYRRSAGDVMTACLLLAW